MTIYRILAVCILAMHQSGIQIFAEPQEIPLREVDIVYQALGRISRGDSECLIVQTALENPSYMAELTQKAAFYGTATQEILAKLIRAKKNATAQHYFHAQRLAKNR